MESKEYTVTAMYDGERADVYLAAVSGQTRSHIKKLCDDGKVFLNGKHIKGRCVLKSGDVVQVAEEPCRNLDVEPENIPLDIIYQDEDIAVINKPQGMTVHAGNGTHGSTLVNALLYHLDSLSGINGVIRPGIVHRIDKNTSGLLVVAKNDAAHLSLSKQIEEKTCKRIYVALLEGVVKEDSGTIETHIARSDRDRTKMAVSAKGRLAVTDFKVLKRYENYTLAEFSLRTGRTHQIRVHAKYMHHPIVGDREYGYQKDKFHLAGQLLHAKELILTHPRTNERMHFQAPIPDYFEKVLSVLK